AVVALVITGWKGPCRGSPASPPGPRAPTIWPLPVLPVPELAPLMVILPVLPSTVPGKRPLPDDRGEAGAAGSRRRDASRGSAATTALNTFIVDSFPTVMDSARADLIAKQPGAVRTRWPDGM